jgi:hypothetical protein
MAMCFGLFAESKVQTVGNVFSDTEIHIFQ